MTTAVLPKLKVTGGSFLFEEADPNDIFTPEDLSEEQQQIAQTAHEFARNEVLPNIEKIEHKDFALTRQLIRKACEIGIGNVDVPEQFGGSDVDKISSLLIADMIAVSGSFSVSFGAHVGLGTLPIVYFGTPEQKAKYLPRLATGEWISALALSEPTSAADLMSLRTKAVLSPDGKEWILNGEKMWTTNGGFADLYILFAKVNGEKFSAFIVERNFPGIQPGAEERKMGLRGSSTTPIVLSDCRVPRENLLGEVGKGHVVAFTTLNLGRCKLAAVAIGSARYSLNSSIGYAKQRKAFGKALSDFGLIKEKLANMAIGVYCGDAISHRTVGMIDAALSSIDRDRPDAHKHIARTIEEYTVECSILKVWASEMLDSVVDETVQLFGGYGFVEEYPAERAYRDSRVYRIFEGTNEINRLLITGSLLRRSMSDQLPPLPAIKKISDETAASESLKGTLGREHMLINNAKKACLILAGAASQKFLMALADQQEIVAAISDMVIEIYVMESVILRTQKRIERSGGALQRHAVAMTQASLARSLNKIEAAARKVVPEIADGDLLSTQLPGLRRLFNCEPFRTISLNQQIANRIIEARKYVVT